MREKTVEPNEIGHKSEISIDGSWHEGMLNGWEPFKPFDEDRPKAMDKETFLQQYVLNRASFFVQDEVVYNTLTDGQYMATDALSAWNTIQELIKSEGGNG